MSTVVEKVERTRIVVLDDVQVRDWLDEDVIAQYAEVIDDLPPIVLYDTGLGNGALELADGYHRLAAAIQAGRTTILAEIRQGRHSDVLDTAETANSKHGPAVNAQGALQGGAAPVQAAKDRARQQQAQAARRWSLLAAAALVLVLGGRTYAVRNRARGRRPAHRR